jgi:hypothetical protein
MPEGTEQGARQGGLSSRKISRQRNEQAGLEVSRQDCGKQSGGRLIFQLQRS